MTRARRFLAAVGATALGLVLVAPPAWAEATLTLDQPESHNGKRHFVEAAEGNVVVLAGEVSSDEGRIDRVDFSFDPPLDESAIEDCRIEPDKSVVVQAGETVATFELVLDAACNRKHRLKAVITHSGPLDPLGVDLTTPPPAETGSIEFGVAIPPRPVRQFGANFNPDTKEVTLSWDANPEPDLRSYIIERNPPGPNGFEELARVGRGETTFVDPGVEDEQIYRITAEREGPNGAIRGQVSRVVSVGPDNPEPTIPPEAFPDEAPGPSRSGSGLSGGSGQSGSGGGDGSSGNSPRRTLTTADKGFDRQLPFEPGRATTVPPTSSTESEGNASEGNAAVLAQFDDDDGGDDRRATMVPIAGGLALMMGAVHLRLLAKRAAEPDIPIHTR